MTIHSLTFEDVAQVRNVRHLLEHAEVEEARLGVERPRPPDVDALHPVAAPAVEHVHVRVRVHQQTTVAERHGLQWNGMQRKTHIYSCVCTSTIGQ